MAIYEVEAPNGKTYEVEGPPGADQSVIIQAILAQHPEAGVVKTIGGYAKEAIKGVGRGAVGFLESAGIGASSLLPEDIEKPVAEKVKSLAERFAPKAAPGYQEAIPTRLGEGIGSMLAPIVIPGGVVGKGLAMTATGAGEARQRAQQFGATPEEISTATAQGVIPGMMDILPFQFLMRGLGPVAATGLVNRAVRMAATGGIEGATEGAQAILQNAIAQGYNPAQGLYEGAAEEATYGGAVGAIAQGLMDIVVPGRGRGGKAVTPPPAPPVTPEAPEVAAPPAPVIPEAPEVAAPPAPVTQEEPVTNVPQTTQTQPVETAATTAPATPQPATQAVAPAAAIQPPAAAIQPPTAAIQPPKQSSWKEFEASNPDEAALKARYEENKQRIAYEKAQPKPFGPRINALNNQQKKIEEALKAPTVAPAVKPEDILKEKAKIPAVKQKDALKGETKGVFDGEPPDTAGRKADRGGDEAPVSERTTGGQRATGIPDTAGVGGTESSTIKPTGGKKAEPGALTVESFVADRVAGKKQDSPDEIQFYQNNALAIEDALQKIIGKPVKGRINKAKLEKKKVAAPLVPVSPERQKRIDEYEQIKTAPKVVKDYFERNKNMDTALRSLGFDLAETSKKGEMGYTKEGGASAREFAAWVDKKGTPEQKAKLEKYQAEYKKLKAKAESEEVVEAREKPQELRLAGKAQAREDARKELEERVEKASGVPVEELETKSDEDIEKALKKATKRERMESRAGEGEIDEEVDQDEARRNRMRMSRGEPARATGNTKDEVTRKLKNNFKEDSRFDALTTTVQKESELPEEIRQAKDYRPGVRGVAHKGKVWLVADNIEPGRELGVFLHEAGAHIGFDNIMKPSDRQFLADQVRKWAKGKNDLVETKAAQAALAKGGTSNDEIIAYMTEELVNRGVKPTSFRPASTWLRRVWEAFKKALKKVEIRADITPQELVDFAYGAAHIAIKAPGKAVEGAPRFTAANPGLDAISQGTLKLVSGPPAPQSLVQRAYQTALDPKPAKFFQNLRQNFANKNTWWEDYITAREGNNALDTAGDAAILERLQAASKVGGIQIATLEKGGLEKGVNKLWQARDTDASFVDILKKVNSMVGKYRATPDFSSAQQVFNLAAIAKREEGLIASGQTTDKGGEIKRTLTDAQLKEGLDAYNSTPEIQEALALYKKFNDRMVDTLVTAGVIDANLAAELKGNVGYVPWFRFMEDANGNISEKAVKGFSKGIIQLSNMRDLEGGKIEDVQIGNVLDNMVKLSNWMVSKSVGNDTAAYMVDYALRHGEARKVGASYAKGIDPRQTVQVMRNGVPTFYEFKDPAAIAAFKGYETAHGAFVNMLAPTANVLRKAITLNPIFSVAQLPQDALRAFVSGGLKNPYAIFARVLVNFVKALFTRTASAETLAKYGIVGKGSGLPTEATTNLRRKLGYHDSKTGGVWGKFVDGLERISAASDEAVRTALYELTLEEGGSQVLALRRAREIINFDTQGAGSAASFLRQTVPFMGVWMNDINNLYKGLVLGSARLTEGEKNATRAAIVSRGLQLAGLVVLYTWMVGDDDDYKKLDDDTRNRSLIVPGTGIRIPVPNDGVGFLFKVIPEEITRAVMAQGIESEDAGAKMGRALWNGFTNLGSFENFIPGVGSPVIKTGTELILNKSFYTGNPIVGKSKENLPPPDQYTDSTSEVAKQLGAALNLSPIKIDYLVRGLSAQVGGAVMGMSSALFNAAEGKVTPSWSGDIKDVPLLGQFGYSRKDKADLEDYYEMRDRVDSVARTYRDMISAGKGKEAIEYITDPTNQKAYALRQLQTRIDKDLGKFRQMEKLVYSNQNLTSDEMRSQLNQIEEMRTKYLQSLRLPKLRAFAEISQPLDASVFKILR